MLIADIIKLKWLNSFAFMSPWEEKFLTDVYGNKNIYIFSPTIKQLAKLREIYEIRRVKDFIIYVDESEELNYSYDEIHNFDK